PSTRPRGGAGGGRTILTPGRDGAVTRTSRAWPKSLQGRRGAACCTLLARRRRPPSFYSHSNPAPNPLPQQGPAMTRGLRPPGTAITLALLGAVLHSSPAPAQA